MSIALDSIDGKLLKLVNYYLEQNRNEELEALVDDINGLLANDIYPKEQIYKVQEIFKQIEQIERIKDLNQRIEQAEKRTEILMKKRSKNEKQR